MDFIARAIEGAANAAISGIALVIGDGVTTKSAVVAYGEVTAALSEATIHFVDIVERVGNVITLTNYSSTE